jgi:hypothetical protein
MKTSNTTVKNTTVKLNQTIQTPTPTPTPTIPLDHIQVPEPLHLESSNPNYIYMGIATLIALFILFKFCKNTP